MFLIIILSFLLGAVCGMLLTCIIQINHMGEAPESAPANEESDS